MIEFISIGVLFLFIVLSHSLLSRKINRDFKTLNLSLNQIHALQKNSSKREQGIKYNSERLLSKVERILKKVKK